MRSPRSIVLLMLVVALVIAVLVLRQADDEVSDPAAVPSASPSASPSPSLSGTSPDAFCTAFRDFAESHSDYVALNDDVSGAAVVAAAEELIGLGRPTGLPMGGWLSLIELVNGAILDIEGATPHPDPDDVAGAVPDVAARDAYLATACPA